MKCSPKDKLVLNQCIGLFPLTLSWREELWTEQNAYFNGQDLNFNLWMGCLLFSKDEWVIGHFQILTKSRQST